MKKLTSFYNLHRRILTQNSGNQFQLHCRRTLSSLFNTNNNNKDEVLIEGKSYNRTAILHRPSVLNALNTSMAAKLEKYYKCWEDDPDIGFVMMKGRGRAFCAGGDIVHLYHLNNKGKIEECKEFFSTLYTFIYILGTYMKPHVALLNGVTMGGGGGVSIPGTFRVATDKTNILYLIFSAGEYLALTSETINGAEMLECGLATHYSLSAKLPQIEEHFGDLVTDSFSVVETSLQEFSDIVSPDNMSVLCRMETLNKCFGHDTVEEIIDTLEHESTKTDHTWCASTLKRLCEVSPLSLKVTLRSIREGRYQTLDECLACEYRMSLQGITGNVSNDFWEGVRARMVDRDFSPKWDPPSLDRVSEDMVSPLSKSEPDLELPTEQREAFS